MQLKLNLNLTHLQLNVVYKKAGVFFHYTAGQSKSSLSVGGVLVVCSSSSYIIITVAVSACTIPSRIISN